MLYLIEEDQFSDAAGYLWQMHRQRYDVFVKKMGWKALDNWLHADIDQFDDADARYLIVIDGPDLIGSLRIRPCHLPTLASAVFPHVYANGHPSDADIWEYTRGLAYRRGWRSEQGLKAISLLHLGLMELALEEGCRGISAILNLQQYKILPACGWPVDILGPAFDHDGGTSIACELAVGEEVLDALRHHIGHTDPVLRRKLPASDHYPTGFEKAGFGAGLYQWSRIPDVAASDEHLPQNLDTLFRLRQSSTGPKATELEAILGHAPY